MSEKLERKESNIVYYVPKVRHTECSTVQKRLRSQKTRTVIQYMQEKFENKMSNAVKYVPKVRKEKV